MTLTLHSVARPPPGRHCGSRFSLDLQVALHHHLLEGDEVIDGQELLEHALAHVCGCELCTELDELVLRRPQVGQEPLDQRIYHVTVGAALPWKAALPIVFWWACTR